MILSLQVFQKSLPKVKIKANKQNPTFYILVNSIQNIKYKLNLFSGYNRVLGQRKDAKEIWKVVVLAQEGQHG